MAFEDVEIPYRGYVILHEHIEPSVKGGKASYNRWTIFNAGKKVRTTALQSEAECKTVIDELLRSK